MELSEEHKTYLYNKHNGGLNNQKGNTFEVIYATKEIIRLYSSRVDLNNTFVSAQIENAFVDDFQIIYEDGLRVYHQCKDTATLTWTTNTKGAPFYDFSWQRTYSNANGEFFKLKIVYSHSDCAIHKNPIPKDINDVTETEFFPAYGTLTATVLASAEFRRYIESVLFADENGYKLDKFLVFAEIIRSEWLELAVPNKRVSLSEIKTQSIDKYRGIINFKDLPNVELSTELRTIFDRFKEFYYIINGSNILWTYKNLSGEFSISDDLSSKIIANNPSDIFQLITMFN